MAHRWQTLLEVNAGCWLGTHACSQHLPQQEEVPPDIVL